MSILVLGSFMMDQVVSTPRAPKNGETIIGNDFSVIPGGKGANQAVAASRLGGSVIMAGKVGKDAHGETFLQTLKKENIDTNFIEIDNQAATGVGFVTSEANGDNRIVIVPGANLKYNHEELLKLNHIFDEVDVLVIQLEMDLSVMESAVKMAKEKNVQVILNPAPGQELNEVLLSNVDYLTPNETELEILSGKPVNNVEEAIIASKILIDRGTRNVVVTLGDNGALLVTAEEVVHIEGYNVLVRDTVAAGDAFNGALTVAITEDMNLEEAIRFANATGALAVTRKGAIPSLPSRAEVEKFLQNNS